MCTSGKSEKILDERSEIQKGININEKNIFVGKYKWILTV